MQKAKRSRAPAAHQALLEQGRGFMRTRQTYIRDDKCLHSTIMACIAQGARTRDMIIRNVPRFVGHSYREIAAVLDAFTGSLSTENLWYRDEAKIYHLHVPFEPMVDPIEMNLTPLRGRKPARTAVLQQSGQIF